MATHENKITYRKPKKTNKQHKEHKGQQTKTNDNIENQRKHTNTNITKDNNRT